MQDKHDRTETSLRLLFELGATQVSLSQAIESFMALESGDWTEATVTWYRRRLDRLAEFLGPDRPLSDLLEPDLEDYVTNLRNRKSLYSGENSPRPEIEGELSPYTLHGHVRAIKRIFRWLHEKEILSVDLARNLKLPKLPKQGRKGVTEENARAILQAAKSKSRDYALLMFMACTGVRVGGVAGLLLSDLNLEHDRERIRRRATVREKGEKERTVVMTKDALDALLTWMDDRPDVDDPHVFLGRSPGQPWHGLKEAGIRQMIKRYKERLDIEGKVSPHQWRHRWFRSNIQAGMPISHVSQLGGHSDIKVTDQFYGQFSIDQLQDSYDKYVEKEGENSDESLEST